MDVPTKVGGLGAVMMVAPFPGADSSEEPTALIATTLATTSSPYSREKGALPRDSIETVHSH